MTSHLLSHNDIKFFIKIISEAGGRALMFQKGDLDIHVKEDSSLVTVADLWVQDFLIKKISRRFRHFQFICEENKNSDVSIREDTVSAIIDPIDGTAMFSMGLPIWCLSVGIFKGYNPVYGFVYSPASDLLFHTDDTASYLNGIKLNVDLNMTVHKETNIFYSSEIRDLEIKFPGKVRNLGSTALHACLSSDNRKNRVLAFIGKSYLWDWAGSVPVIEKAGGHLNYLDGSDIDYREIIENGFEMQDYVVAYNTDNFTYIKEIFCRKQ